MIWLLFFLSIGPREIFDDAIPGLRYDDPPNTWNEDQQFLNDGPLPEEIVDPPLPEILQCEENQSA